LIVHWFIGLLVICFASLVIGHLLRVIGHWSLVIQCRLLKDSPAILPHLNPLQPRAALALAVAQGEDFNFALL